LLAAAWQKATLDWWDTQRDRFDIYTSDVTMEEAGRGDTTAAGRRLEVLSCIPVLEITNSVSDLAKALLKGGALPVTALDDALHVAVCAVHGIDYLMTWNFRHLDNAETKPIIRIVCTAQGYTAPEICTPQELMGVNEDD
jgi:predicted nucleic acid-binding protein